MLKFKKKVYLKLYRSKGSPTRIQGLEKPHMNWLICWKDSECFESINVFKIKINITQKHNIYEQRRNKHWWCRDNNIASEYEQIEGHLKQMLQTQLSVEARQQNVFVYTAGNWLVSRKFILSWWDHCYKTPTYCKYVENKSRFFCEIFQFFNVGN